MPMFNSRPSKELPANQGVESIKVKDKLTKDQWFSYNTGQTATDEPTRDPRSIGSSIVRRNEPDDED